MTASSVPVVPAMAAAVAIFFAARTPTAASPLCATSPWLAPSPWWLGASHAVGVLEAIIAAAGLGPVVPALVCLHTPADRFRRHASADLDIGLFDRQPADDWPATAAAKLSGKHPLTVGVRQLVDGDDADAGLVVTAIARAKPYAPSCLRRSC